MKRLIKYLNIKAWFLLFPILFTSCATIQVGHKDKLVHLTKKNLKQIEGRYSIVTNLKSTDLSKELKSDYNHFGTRNNIVMEISVIDKRTLEIKEWHLDKLVDSYKIKGRLVEGGFQIQRTFFILPIPLLFFHIYDSRCRITVDKKYGNLVLDEGTFGFLNLAVVMWKKEESHDRHLFKRLD